MTTHHLKATEGLSAPVKFVPYPNKQEVQPVPDVSTKGRVDAAALDIEATHLDTVACAAKTACVDGGESHAEALAVVTKTSKLQRNRLCVHRFQCRNI